MIKFLQSFLMAKLEKQPVFPDALFRGILVTMIISAIAIPLVLVAVPYIPFFNDMTMQPKAKAQGTYGTDLGEDIISARSPVAGTYPRSYKPYAITDTGEAGVAAAGLRLSNSMTISEKSLKRGQHIYNTFCAVCHGPMGEGNGSVIGPERFPAPPSLHTQAASALPDGSIYHIITKGKGKMPSYARQIEELDRWHAVNYLRALQRALAPRPKDFKK